MTTFDAEWVAELSRQTEQDLLCWQLYRQMDEAAVAYEAFHQTLKPEERKILDDYYHISKQIEVCLTRTAYQIGVDRGCKKQADVK